MPVIRTSLGIAYSVLIAGISDTMNMAYKNTLGSIKYVCIAYILYVCVYENRFQTMALKSSMFLLAIFIVSDMPAIRTLYAIPNDVLITGIHCVRMTSW